ncbi:hypothetical protein [Hymenobacter sp. BT730]|uniref:hypothetical protein n=1 Tax=Hymenobacter sp. BT730 TaxID=3063332 RepID=UPI0026E03E4B|nr:hypothetical protein [Hymenobacter sp. BT730]
MAIRLKPITWRLLALHMISVPFLVLGMQQLFLIQYIDLVQRLTELQTHYGQEYAAHFSLPPGFDSFAQLILELELRDAKATFLALLIACTLSGIVVWHRRESLLIPLMLFLSQPLVFGLSGFYKEPVVTTAINLLYSISSNPVGKLQLAVVGSLLFIVGVLPFCITWRKHQSVSTSDITPVGAHL